MKSRIRMVKAEIGNPPVFETVIDGKVIRFNPFPGARIMPCGHIPCPISARLKTIEWKKTA